MGLGAALVGAGAGAGALFRLETIPTGWPLVSTVKLLTVATLAVLSLISP